jgi:hypothetical protein
VESYLSQLLNVHNISDVREIEIHKTKPLVPGPIHLEFEIAIAKVKKYKSPGSNQIPAELFQAVGETLVSVIQKFITSMWNKEEFPDHWKERVFVPVHEKDHNTYCNISLGQQDLSNILLSKGSSHIDEVIVD